MNETTAIVLPGLDGTGLLLEQFARLAPPGTDCRIVRYPPQQPLPYESLIELVQQQLPPSGQLLLIGESFSGPIAVAVAATLGSRCTALVLVASFVRSPGPRLARLLPWGALFRLRPPPWVIRRLISGSVSPALARDIRSAVSQVGPGVLAGRLRSVLGADFTSELSNCVCPVLYLQAARDRLVPARCASEVRQVARTAEVAQVAQSHFILQEQPQCAWECIGRFLEVRTAL